MRNRLGFLIVVVVIVIASMPASASADSAGDVIVKFVTNSFMSGSISSIQAAGGAAVETAKKALPIPDFQAMLQQVKAVVSVVRILKIVGMPENLDINQQLALLRKIGNMGGDFTAAGAELRKVLAGIKDSAAGYASAAGASGAVTGGQMSNQGGGGVEESSGLCGPQGTGLGVGQNESGLSLKDSGLGTKEPESIIQQDAGIPGLSGGSAEGSSDEVPTGVFAELIEKAVKVMMDNADAVEEVGKVTDTIDSVENAVPQAMTAISGKIDEQGGAMLAKYGISQQDIDLAQSVISGGKSSSGFENVRMLLAALGKSNTLDVFKKLSEIADGTKDPNKAMELAVQMAELIPDASNAVSGLIPK
jgi:hypothetical protein